ncbi:hypothetical protein [Cypionkella sp.]|uniref:hypothetical protein n=1 Tax=Cypionkella sp. TaxID=2811411 RepID=UPI003753BC26
MLWWPAVGHGQTKSVSLGFRRDDDKVSAGLTRFCHFERAAARYGCSPVKVIRKSGLLNLLAVARCLATQIRLDLFAKGFDAKADGFHHNQAQANNGRGQHDLVYGHGARLVGFKVLEQLTKFQSHHHQSLSKVYIRSTVAEPSSRVFFDTSDRYERIFTFNSGQSSTAAGQFEDNQNILNETVSL